MMRVGAASRANVRLASSAGDVTRPWFRSWPAPHTFPVSRHSLQSRPETFVAHTCVASVRRSLSIASRARGADPLSSTVEHTRPLNSLMGPDLWTYRSVAGVPVDPKSTDLGSASGGVWKRRRRDFLPTRRPAVSATSDRRRATIRKCLGRHRRAGSPLQRRHG